MKLSKQDNNRLLEYVHQYNIDRPISQKMTFDCYVHEIYTEGNETILSCEVIKPEPPEGCDESNIKVSEKIGSHILIKMSNVEDSVKNIIFIPFLRDKKISDIYEF